MAKRKNLQVSADNEVSNKKFYTNENSLNQSHLSQNTPSEFDDKASKNLIQACGKLDFEQIGICLKNNADPNFIFENNTALLATLSNDKETDAIQRKEIIELLLENGANWDLAPQCKDEDNFDYYPQHPLFMANLLSDCNIIDVFIKFGADINKQVSCNTLLLQAVLLNIPIMVSYLIKSGAQIDILIDDMTPLMHALTDDEMEFNDERIEIIEILLKHGAVATQEHLECLENSNNFSKDIIETKDFSDYNIVYNLLLLYLKEQSDESQSQDNDVSENVSVLKETEVSNPNISLEVNNNQLNIKLDIPILNEHLLDLFANNNYYCSQLTQDHVNFWGTSYYFNDDNFENTN